MQGEFFLLDLAGLTRSGANQRGNSALAEIFVLLLPPLQVNGARLSNIQLVRGLYTKVNAHCTSSASMRTEARAVKFFVPFFVLWSSVGDAQRSNMKKKKAIVDQNP